MSHEGKRVLTLASHEQHTNLGTNWLRGRCPPEERPAGHWFVTATEGVQDYGDEVLVKVSWMYASKPKGFWERSFLNAFNFVRRLMGMTGVMAKSSSEVSVSRTAVLIPNGGVLQIIKNKTGLNAREVYGIVHRNASVRSVKRIPDLDLV